MRIVVGARRRHKHALKLRAEHRRGNHRRSARALSDLLGDFIDGVEAGMAPNLLLLPQVLLQVVVMVRFELFLKSTVLRVQVVAPFVKLVICLLTTPVAPKKSLDHLGGRRLFLS